MDSNGVVETPIGNSDLYNLFLDITDNQEARDKARQICAEFLGGSWANCNDNEFELSKVSGGMTNLMFRCDLNRAPIANEPIVALLRIQCQKDLMQLQNELAIFITLAKAGLGPEMLGIFPGGRLEQYIPSRTLTYEETASAHYSYIVAKVMAKTHHVSVPLKKTSQIVSTLREHLERAKRNGGQEWKIWSKAGISESTFPPVLTVDDISAQIDEIEEYMKNCTCPCYLTHNDLFATNILLKDGFEVLPDGTVLKDGKPSEIDEDPLVLIDFEFGMYNYRSFDIGNHLNELAMTYGGPETYEVLMDKMDNVEMKVNYCRGYLEQTYQLLPISEVIATGLTGEMERDIEILLKKATDFQALANFFWAVWNIVCVQENIQGMDFDNAFRDRFALYYHFKKF